MDNSYESRKCHFQETLERASDDLAHKKSIINRMQQHAHWPFAKYNLKRFEIAAWKAVETKQHNIYLNLLTTNLNECATQNW
ncbi:hypothetical protein T09_2552 [Trichinella sp. T9]|nr:hypothetical protein T09_2552 [Trichinella sp. T9]